MYNNTNTHSWEKYFLSYSHTTRLQRFSDDHVFHVFGQPTHQQLHITSPATSKTLNSSYNTYILIAESQWFKVAFLWTSSGSSIDLDEENIGDFLTPQYRKKKKR